MPRITSPAVLALAAIAALAIGLGVGLAVFGGGGVAQGDYDAVKQQLDEAQKKQTQLKFPGYESYPGYREATLPMLGAIPNAPPRPTATPLPPGAPTPAPAPAAVAPPAKVVPLYVYVDTVTAGPAESKYTVDANLSCVKTGVFKRGMHIVWRMEVVDTSTGKILQAADVRNATLKLPNGEEVQFRYGRHGRTEDSPWFWTAAWSVPPDFPLGVLDYTLTVNAQDGKSVTTKDPLAVSIANFQPGLSLDSRVTILP